jgi:hypothetical protein
MDRRGQDSHAVFAREWDKNKKATLRMADFWFCLCVTGTLAGDLGNGLSWLNAEC